MTNPLFTREPYVSITDVADFKEEMDPRVKALRLNMDRKTSTLSDLIAEMLECKIKETDFTS